MLKRSVGFIEFYLIFIILSMAFIESGCTTNHLETVLQDVHKEIIKIEKDEAQRAVRIIDQMLLKVQRTIEYSDFPLKSLRNGVTYRGSYYSGVKIKNADEFDIDIRIKLPPMNKELITLSNTEPGYISINIKKAFEEAAKNPTWLDKYGGLKKFMDEKGFLMPTIFRTELESFFTKNFRPGSMELPNGQIIKVKPFEKHGPAFTFKIEHEGLKIDVDFVFVIDFNVNKWPPKPVRKYPVSPKEESTYFWFAVPKPSYNARSWRISFPKQENDFLDSAQNLKYCLRLIKALRDQEKWRLASYHIATLFLWEAEKYTYEKKYWQQSGSKLFLIMLRKLSMAMSDGKIPFFWHKDCNMVEDFEKDTFVNIHNRIEGMLKKIDRLSTDREGLREYVMHEMYRIPKPFDRPICVNSFNSKDNNLVSSPSCEEESNLALWGTLGCVAAAGLTAGAMYYLFSDSDSSDKKKKK